VHQLSGGVLHRATVENLFEKQGETMKSKGKDGAASLAIRSGRQIAN